MEHKYTIGAIGSYDTSELVTAEELKPCPFCGGQVMLVKTAQGITDNGDYAVDYKVGCHDCGIWFHTRTEMHLEGEKPVFCRNGLREGIRLWNRRAE